MKKLDVVPGKKALGLCCSPGFLVSDPDDLSILSKLRQQHLVTSPDALEYYLSQDDETSVILNGFLTAYGGIDGYIDCYATTPGKTLAGIFSELLKRFTDSILVADEEEFAPQEWKTLRKQFRAPFYSRVTVPGSILTDRGNALNRYSLPVMNYQAFVDDRRDLYLKWFKDLLSDRDTIDIVDPYFLTFDTVKVFNECYLNCIKTHATVNVYCYSGQDHNWSDGELNRKIDRRNNDIHVYLCKNGLHDRWLQTNDMMIMIGHGLDFISAESDTVKHETFINVSKKPADLPEAYKEL